MTAPDRRPCADLVSNAAGIVTEAIQVAYSSGYTDGWNAAHKEASERGHVEVAHLTRERDGWKMRAEIAEAYALKLEAKLAAGGAK